MPCLLLRNRGLVKTIRFADPAYVGDPINTVRIYNEKEVDELIILDITATLLGKGPSLELLQEVASECFMPFAYGGGIRTLEDMAAIFKLGAEKVVLNSAAHEDPELVRRAAERFGSQSIVVSVDCKKQRWPRSGYVVRTHGGRRNTTADPVDYAERMQSLGAGEILLTSIDNDGMMEGYDLGLIAKVAKGLKIPVIACGGAGRLTDFQEAVNAGASAVAAGSMVVYQGKNRAVLVNFPPKQELRTLFD